MKSQIKSLLWPTLDNQYQAYLARPLAVITLITLTVLINASWLSFNPLHFVAGVNTDLTESQIISLTNLERTKAGVNTLKPNDILSKAAMAKAQNMIKTQNFDHYYEAEGTTVNPWQFILDSGYNYLHAGENLGKGFYSSPTLVQAWIDSPTHRANLLSDQYSDIGVAVVEGPYLNNQHNTLVVQLFATPITDLSQQIDPESINNINIAPLIEHQDSWTASFFDQYPIVLFGLTSSITALVGVTIIIDLTKARKQRQKIVSRELWFS